MGFIHGLVYILVLGSVVICSCASFYCVWCSLFIFDPLSQFVVTWSEQLFHFEVFLYVEQFTDGVRVGFVVVGAVNSFAVVSMFHFLGVRGAILDIGEVFGHHGGVICHGSR